MTKVVLSGGSVTLRDSLRHQLSASPMQVLGEADDPAEMPLAARELPVPDVVLTIDRPSALPPNTEWHVPFSATWPAVRILALITNRHTSLAAEALQWGADGCLFAGEPTDTLVLALQLVAVGQTVCPDQVGRSFFRDAAAVRDPHLTPRELEILQGLVLGPSNKMIANALGTTHLTVKAQLRHLLRKLGLTNRTQAALWAQEHGYMPSQDGIDRRGSVAHAVGHH